MGKFLVGLIFGVLIAIGVVYYLNNNQSKFVNKISASNTTNESTSGVGQSTVLEPSTKIKEAPNSQSEYYDFYQILQNDNASETKPTKDINGNKAQQIMLQVGVFSDISAAKDIKGRLAFLGYEAKINGVEGSGGLKNIVVIGPFKSELEAKEVKKDLDSNGIKSVLIKL